MTNNPPNPLTTQSLICLIGIEFERYFPQLKEKIMYVRSVDVLEQELKDFLSNPHSSKNLEKAVNKAKKNSKC